MCLKKKSYCLAFKGSRQEEGQPSAAWLGATLIRYICIEVRVLEEVIKMVKKAAGRGIHCIKPYEVKAWYLFLSTSINTSFPLISSEMGKFNILKLSLY